MKKSYLLSVFVLLFLFPSLFAREQATVKEQLAIVNSYWENKNFSDPFLSERILLKNEVELIRTHLSIVEQKLRAAGTDALSPGQRANRLACLGILNRYWKRGIFPQNTFHRQRTPYFKDIYGTNCAVGELIVESGHADLAAEISRADNYAYIRDMHFAALDAWAETHGFAAEELMWIQPCYNFTPPAGTLVHVTCPGGWDGAWCPDPSTTGLVPPYTYQYSNPCGGSSLSAGTYSCTVTDAMGNTVVFMQTITEPPPIDPHPSSTDDNGSCNGTATVAPTGGTGPNYTYQWTSTNPVQTTATATGLCAGTHTVTITDAAGCTNIALIPVNVVTGIDETAGETISLYPNPSSGEVMLRLPANASEGTISVRDLPGKEVLLQNTAAGSTTVLLDLSGLTNGVYVCTYTNPGGATSTAKILLIK